MGVVLGVNAVFHDPAVALVIDGQIVAVPGRAFDDASIASQLATAAVPHDQPGSVPAAVAQGLTGDGVVGSLKGRGEWGPRVVAACAS